MTLTRKLLAAGALTAVIAFPLSSASAQGAGSMGDSGSSASEGSSMGASSASGSGAMSDSSAAAPAQAAQVDDATLQKAAKAYVKVKEIVHQSKQTNPSSDTAANAQPATQSDKLNAVRGEGLEPQQYNQIIQMVQNDPQLQQKFAAYVNQNGGDSD